jgi:Trypsin-like peptidase domain
MRIAAVGILIVLVVGVVALSLGAAPSQVIMSGKTSTSGKTITSGGPVYPGTWSDLPRRATLSVGQIDANGKFTTGGAAVVIRDTKNRCFIATALHVFFNPKQNFEPVSLQIRGWRDETKDRSSDQGSTLWLKRGARPLYLASANFDLAIVDLTQDIANRLYDDDHKLFTYDPTTIAGDSEVYDGQDVFILGFPGLVGEEYQQRALMRSGVVAWTDSSPPLPHEFLVDARIFPGNSGGPVLSTSASLNRDGTFTTGNTIKLLGIVSLTINAKPELALGMELPDNAKVIGAAGVGVVEPAQELLNLMAKMP